MMQCRRASFRVGAFLFFAFCYGVVPASAGLMISEVMFAPGQGTPAWVEIYNSSDTELDFDGVELFINPGSGGLNSGSFQLGLGTSKIDSGEFVVFYDNSDPAADDDFFRTLWPNTPLGDNLFGVNGGGSWSDGMPAPVFSLTQGNAPPFFETTQFTSFGTNQSIFMPDLTADPLDPQSWVLSGGLGASGGSEGSASGIGTPGSGPSVVPEPSTLMMFAIATMGLSTRWRRRRRA